MFPHGNRNVAIFMELAFFLLMVNLLEYLGMSLLSGFGMFGMPRSIALYLSPLLNIVGTVLYLRYRLMRSVEYAGISFESGWALPLGAGTVLGLALPLVAASVGGLIGQGTAGGMPTIAAAGFFLQNFVVALLAIILQMLAVAMVHHGLVSNRILEEFPYWKALGFAMLFWALSFGFKGMVLSLPSMDAVHNALLYAFSVLLFWRTENLWWPVFVQVGNALAHTIFFGRFEGIVSAWQAPPSYLLWLVWGLACGVIMYMDWRDRQPQQTHDRRTFRSSGKMIKGPWGPH